MRTKPDFGAAATLTEAPGSEAVLDIGAKLDMIIRLLDEQVHLQKVALLENGHILRFVHDGMQEIALSLPQAQQDYVQRMILKARGFYEPRLLAAVRDMGVIGPKVTVCDVGANIGNHSVYFGKVLGAKRVLSFEPQPSVYGTLCRNLELNGLTDALAYNCLVGAKSGRGAVTRFNPRNLGGTAFAPGKAGEIPMLALDDLIDADEMRDLGFIKIDVEGMQMDVLKGAQKILKDKRPTLWVELLARDDAYPAAAKFLAGFGYDGRKIGPNDHVFIAG